jgi:DNA modification methylase
MTDRPDPLKVEYRKVSELLPYARNSRTHTDEQVAELAGLIKEFGWTEPIITKGNTIAAGHARLRAARILGMDTVPVIDRADMTDAQFRAYVIADNRVAEKAGWDMQVLASEFAGLRDEGFALDFTGFDEKQRLGVEKAADKARRDQENGQEGEDDPPKVPVHPVSRPGDLWHLGPHRLIVGDSFEKITRKRLIGSDQVHLIACDPPYAIYGNSAGVASDIADDKMVRPFFERALRLASEHLPWFGHAYFFTDWRSWASIWEAARTVPGLVPKNMLVWDKGGAGLGSNYAMTHELVAFFHKLPKQTAMGHRQAGIRSVMRPNILRHNRVTGEERQHNAAKPVALMRDLIEASTGPGDLVFDPFCGSGTTLIAADQTNRLCITSEIDPINADIAVHRFKRLRPGDVTLGEGGPTFETVQAQRDAEDNG